jgi:hypothetical protein
MPKYYFFHFTKGQRFPKLPPEQGEAVKGAIADFIAKNPDCKYNGTMLDPASGIAISDWDAPNDKVLRDFAKAMGIPYDDVVPVVPLPM